MKRKLLSVISVMILIIAAGAALYPTISAWINNWMAKGEITRYNDTVDSLSAEEKTLVKTATHYITYSAK